ncbi:MAG: ATP-binding protein, partial [Nitrosopumilus sp.]
MYRSPADALKELVSNSYDADSPTMNINFSPNFSSLILQDFGKGMTTDEFIQVMETIGGTDKRSFDAKNGDTTE